MILGFRSKSFIDKKVRMRLNWYGKVPLTTMLLFCLSAERLAFKILPNLNLSNAHFQKLQIFIMVFQKYSILGVLYSVACSFMIYICCSRVNSKEIQLRRHLHRLSMKIDGCYFWKSPKANWKKDWLQNKPFFQIGYQYIMFQQHFWFLSWVRCYIPLPIE